MRRIIGKLKPLLQNIYVAVYTLIRKRNKNVVLVGAWMGEKFSDNSRFLFQYLFENKDKLGLEKVVWVTRNGNLNDLLNSLGYESYLIGTPESKYWHLKAGVHILCNMAFPQTKVETDIDTRYSWGSVKFQLWHGVGMKSVGAASNNAHSLGNVSVSRFHNSRIATWCTLGGWNEEYFLSTSERNAEVNYAISLCRKDHLFISAYPRNCECIRMLPEEKDVIATIRKYSKVIGFFPTFRSDNTEYVHPLKNQALLQFLKNNDVLWVEKRHSADASKSENLADSNILLLDKNFDLNVLYNAFDLVVSDYSSVVFDCIYKMIPVVMYCPDLERFKNGDVGFLFDIESYCEGIVVKNVPDCIELIDDSFHGMFFSETIDNTYRRIQKEFFNNRKSDYKDIWNDMKRIINL